MDVVVKITGVYLIHVTESFMDYLFSGIITISVLCFSFVTIISSFLEKIYLGYRLRDIIQFPNSPINIKEYIIVSLGTIFIGVFLLLFCFANSLTALLLALVWIEGKVAFTIYDMIIDEKYLYELVKDYFSSSIKKRQLTFDEFSMHTDNITNALNICINENNGDEKDKALNMLADLVEQVGKDNKYDKYYDYFNYKVSVFIDNYVRVFGFNDMLNSIVKVYIPLTGFEYGRRDLYVIPMKNIQFWTDQQLLKNNYFNEIKEIYLLDIYINKSISNDEVEIIIFKYFNSIMNNDICTENVREQLVEGYMKELLKLNWKTNSAGVNPDVNTLLKILNCYVLKNNNIKEREYILQVIIIQTFNNSNTYEREKYFEFLALFFQSFYAYTFLEVETLTEKYREGLLKTFKLEFSSQSIDKMSASLLLRINIIDILSAMRRIICRPKSGMSRFENSAEHLPWKNIVWTQEFDITFMFMLYFIFYDEFKFYNLNNSLFNFENINDDKLKINILKKFQSKFNEQTGLLKQTFIEQYSKYGAVLNSSSNITDQIQKNLFDLISKEYEELDIENCSLPLEVKDEDIMKGINLLMEKNQVFGWKLDYSKDNYEDFTSQYCICRRENITVEISVIKIQKCIIEAVGKYIRQYSNNKLILTFDLEGVRLLNSFIEENKYDARNYTFTDDLGLAKLKNEDDFLKLKQKEIKIELISTPQIYESLYFVKEKFRFNVQEVKIDRCDLSEKECANFLEEYKCYNGLYNVDGALMAKEKAMKIVKKIYQKERFSFKLMICLNKDDVRIIDFKD